MHLNNFTAHNYTQKAWLYIYTLIKKKKVKHACAILTLLQLSQTVTEWVQLIEQKIDTWAKEHQSSDRNSIP